MYKRQVIEAADLNSVEGRVRAAQSTAPIIAEHPNDVVRDQYIVETAEKVRVEIPQLRQQVTQAALRPREDRNSTNADIPPERPQNAAVPAVELNLLRACIHDKETIAHLTLPSMFTNPAALESYELISGEKWQDRMSEASEEAQSVIGRLLVEELQADPVELVSRALDALIERWNAELKYDVKDIEQLRKYQPTVQWLAQRKEEMHSDETRNAAVAAVVDWLRSQKSENSAK